MKNFILRWIAALVAVLDLQAASFGLQPVRNLGSGAASQDSRFKLTSSIGQPFTAMPTGRVYVISSGFWPAATAVPVPPPCLLIYCPTNLFVPCTNADGTVVTFDVRATNMCAPNASVFVSCTPPSGTAFRPGTTPVECVASSMVNNQFVTNRCSFTVTVSDDCPPSSFNDVTYTVACTDFGSRPLGPLPNPLEEDGLKVSAINSAGGPEFAAILDNIAGRTLARGYYVQYTVDMEFTRPCRSVNVDLFQLENPLVLTAYDSVGNMVAGPFSAPGSAGPDGVARSIELTSTGNLIHRVLVHAPNALATIQRVCGRIPREGPCVDFPIVGDGTVVNPLVTSSYTFTTFFHRDPDFPWFANRVITIGGEAGLRLAMFTDLRLSTPCPILEMSFRGSGSAMTVKVFDPTDVLIETRTISPPADPATVLTLSGNIQRVALERSDTNAILTRLCRKTDPQETGTPVGPFASLSRAPLTATPAGTLVVSNVPGSGLNGLRVDLGGEPSVRLDFGERFPASNAPPGATFGVILRGQDFEALGQFGWTASGDFWYPAQWTQGSSGYETIGSPTYTARIYLGNQLVSEAAGLQAGIAVRCIPPIFVAEKQSDGQLRLSLDYGLGDGLFRVPGVGDMVGTRIDFISERPQPMVPLNLRIMDLRWSGITFRPLHPTPLGCLSILTQDIVVTCAGPDGARVYYNVIATNTCTHSTQPANCAPPSGAHFDLGTTLVTCFAGTANHPVFGAFRVTTTRDESGALIQNPGFESIAPPPPPGGTAFGLATVPGWTPLNTEASVHGLGGLLACEGTNYAGLRGEVVNGIFKSGAVEGSLIHPLAQGGTYQFMACIALARGTGAWVEFVLSDGNPAHEQVIAQEFAEYLGSWQPLRRGVTIPVAAGEVPGVRFIASHPHDRILVRTIPTLEGRASNGNVFIDDLRLGCFMGLVPGTTVPRSLTIRWTGDGILQSAPALGANVPWTDANVPVTHDGNVHQTIVPMDGNTPSAFFRLRIPTAPPGP